MALSDGLIALWHMNSNWLDSSGNGHDGTPTGAIFDTVNQKLGSACGDFDGIDDFITIPDSDDLSFGDATSDTPFSMMFWINMVDASAFRIISKGLAGANEREYLFGTTGSDKLQLILYDNTNLHSIRFNADDAITTDEGSWIQIFATYDGTGNHAGLNVYKNNSAVAGVTAEVGTYVAMHDFSYDVTLGREFVNGATYADGLMDEIAIWNRVLTSAERTELWNGGAGIEVPAPPTFNPSVARNSNHVIGGGIIR